MSIFSIFGRKANIELKGAVAQELDIRAVASDERNLSRLATIFTYLAQKGDSISEERRASFLAEATRRAHALAAKGYPFIETLPQLEEILNGSSSS